MTLRFNAKEECLTSYNDPEDCRCLSTAYRFIIRELGNSVDRIDGMELIDLETAKTESQLPGRHRMPIPIPLKVKELCEVATDAGLCKLCSGCVPTAFSRAIDENTIEVIIWRSP